MKKIRNTAALFLSLSLLTSCGAALDKGLTENNNSVSSVSEGTEPAITTIAKTAAEAEPADDGYAENGGLISDKSESFISDEAVEAPSYDSSFSIACAEGEAAECLPDRADCEYEPPKYNVEPQAGMLTAGEWNDNRNFDLWRELCLNRNEWHWISDSWGISTVNRIPVHVSMGGSAAENIKVRLWSDENLLWSAVTDNKGTAYLFTTIESGNQYKPTHITFEKNGLEALPPYQLTGKDEEIYVTEDRAEKQKASGLDLMLLVDTTGSMGDELIYLQTELTGVINRVVKDKQTDIRLSVNFYRDEGDEYVVRGNDFTDDIKSAVSFMQEQEAYGGGDYPEAVERALEYAVRQNNWNENNTKLMFLVLDAPPHSYEDTKRRIRTITAEAAANGIRIIPVASSGVDTETEFLCRSFAAATGGTYTFLTNDSGIGGDHLEPTIGEYQVERLNDMLVRIIEEYLA